MSKQSIDSYYAKKQKYFDILIPLFLPDDPVNPDIVNYFASLLRVFGAEDRGWDPYAESSATIDDLRNIFDLNLPQDRFPDPNATRWRIGLLFYTHVVEMDAPYEVLVNLLRFRLNKGYNPDGFSDFLMDKKRRKGGLYPGRKIKIIQELSDEAGLPEVGRIFDDFYDNHLRNAVGHSDFILADNEFRCRGNFSSTKSFRMPYEKLDETMCSMDAFIGAFFQAELIARQFWGSNKHQAIPYDLAYKGLMEVLVDPLDTMCGFRVHWPNGTDSTYRRTENGTEMDNCYFDLRTKAIALCVNEYVQQAGEFSPLVKRDAEPVYSSLEGCDVIPNWPDHLEIKHL